MQRLHLTVAMGLVISGLGVGACETPGGGAVYAYDLSGPGVDVPSDGVGQQDAQAADGDAAVDAATDALPDAAPDTATDTATDTAADTAPDTATDTAADTAPDTATDTAPDTATDTAPDTATDTAADTAPDTATDTAADTVTDTAPDTATDTATDTAADTVTDTAPDTATDTAADTATDVGPDTATDTGPDACSPACAGLECGDDGCGGSCGSCAGAATCVAGLCQVPATPGDNCDAPLELAGSLPIQVSGDTSTLADDFSVGAGDCPGLNALGGGDKDAVYRFTAPAAGDYDFTLSGAFDTALYVATTCADPGGTCLGDDDQICTGCDEVVSVTLAQGEQVFVYVDSWGGGSAAGAFTLSVDAAAACVPSCGGAECGDDGCGGSCGTCQGGQSCDQGACVAGTGLTCGQAIAVDAVPYSDANVTPGYGWPDVFVAAGDCPGIDHATGQDGTNRFYAFTAPAAGDYRFTVTSDTMSPALYVSSGCDVAGTCLAGADAEVFCGSGCTETVALSLSSGQSVYAVVDGESVWQEGAYTFSIHETCIPSCAGKQCGGDGCGGSCGYCTGTADCLGGQCVVPDPADACANADPVGALPWTTTGAVGSKAALSFSAGDCPGWSGSGGAGDEHVYSLTAPSSGRYWLDLTMPGDLNVDLYVIRDCLDIAGTCLGASAWGFTGQAEHVELDLTAGEQVFVVVDAHALHVDDWGTYTLSVTTCTPDCAGVACGLDTACGTSCGSCAPPTSTCGTTSQCDGAGQGESCAAPFVGDALPYAASSTTEGAADDAALNYCGDPTGPSTPWGQGTEDQVYRFTPTEDGAYRGALTVGKGFTGALYVTTSCADASAGCLAEDRELCADDYPNCVDEVTVPLLAGTDYFFVVDGYAGQAGPYTFSLEQTCTSQCGAKVCGPDPCMGSCGTCPGGAPCQPDGTCGPVGKLVLNEVDYDQPGGDTAEFVEVFNAGGADADLTGVTLEVVNGTGGGVLETVDLGAVTATLAPGAYLVVGSASVVAGLPGGTASTTLSDGFLQNGGADGDAVRLKGAGGATLDAMSYEAHVVGASEGSGDAGTDTGAGALGRCPNGVDTDDNAADFTLAATPTPGAANDCP